MATEHPVEPPIGPLGDNFTISRRSDSRIPLWGELHRGGEEALKSGHQLAQALPAVAISAAPVDNFDSFILLLISVNEHIPAGGAESELPQLIWVASSCSWQTPRAEQQTLTQKKGFAFIKPLFWRSPPGHRLPMVYTKLSAVCAWLGILLPNSLPTTLGAQVAGQAWQCTKRAREVKSEGRVYAEHL
ncbi:hypothetical protein EYF80_005660 [Liparis tanakae]|uniref:Uncharacterized protein n=1 Tax=Liparis tanakae TaxID=230148 RepID=A0A4Z2J2J1_9TELE|nr:hypothetical protein EYF80_005660 [Liparis tanakae]